MSHCGITTVVRRDCSFDRTMMSHQIDGHIFGNWKLSSFSISKYSDEFSRNLKDNCGISFVNGNNE
jgi:hypothetical protein